MDLRRPLSRRLALGAGGLSLLAACGPSRTITEDGSFDLMTLLRDKSEHTRFVNALVVSGQVSRVGRQNGAVTLFVPTDPSMNNLPLDLLRLLDSPPSSPTAEQRALAAAFVNANAAFGLLRLEDIEARRGQVTTWDRGRLTVARTGPRTGTITRTGGPAGRAPVQITRANILASDGVYHATNSPILAG